MSGGSKQQTVGFRYGLGVHMGVCLEADALLELRAGDRLALLGEITSTSSVSIDQPQLFGGDDREGGIQGTLDVMMGRPDQMPNAYLTSVQGGLQPGYRGFLGLVFRGLITSNNPYIKNWEARVRSILTGWDGEPWYPEKARIPVGSSRFRTRTALYVALDISGSMQGSKLLVLKQAMSIVFDQLEDTISSVGFPVFVRVVAWSSSSTFVESAPATLAGISTLRAFVEGLVATGGTNAVAAYGGMQDFFTAYSAQSRVVVCVSDGEMTNVSEAQDIVASTIGAVGEIAMRGVGIQTRGSLASFDNSGEQVPVISGSNAEELATVILAAMTRHSQYSGMNPAHILYQALTDPDWGMGYPRALINDESFRAAADRFHTEGLGLCMKWVNQASVRSFTQTVADHASFNYGQNRKTGRFEIQPLRLDYVEAELPVFTQHNSRLVSYQRPSLADTVNEIIIEYVDVVTGKESSTAPIQNLANIAAQGRVISQKLSFPGIPSHDLAARVGMRELQSRSTPLWRMKLEMHRGEATKILSGKPFIVDYTDTPVGVRVILRPVEVNLGTATDSVIVIDAVEDVFGMPSAAYVGEPPPLVEPPDTAPKPADGIAFEVPFREIVQTIGQAEALTLPTDASYIGAAAIRPAGVPMNFTLATRLGVADYSEAGTGDFAPSAIISADVPRSIGPTTVAYNSPTNLSAARIGDAAWLGSELVRIDAIDTGAMTITLGRGCADTLPESHQAGARLWIFDDHNAYDPEQYVTGELVNAKVLTNATGGRLPVGDAAAITVQMAGRAARPYPPGNCRVNGAHVPTNALDFIQVTWAHRDRVTQSDMLLEHGAGNVGPEPGTTYALTLENDAQEVVYSASGLTGTEHQIPEAAIPFDSDTALLRLWSERAGLTSLQSYVVEIALPTADGGDIEFVMDEPENPSSGYGMSFNMGAGNE